MFHSWIQSYDLSGVSKVSHFVIWSRIKKRTPKCTPEAQGTPFPKFSNNYILWYGQVGFTEKKMMLISDLPL